MINFGDYKSVLELSPDSALVRLSQPGLTFRFTGTGVMSREFMEEEVTRIAGSIPVVVLPSFKVESRTVAQASAVFTVPLPTPGYLPPGFSLQGIFTPANYKRAIMVFAKQPITDKIETLADIFNLWDRISRGVESGPAIIVHVVQGGSWSLANVETETLQIGGSTVWIGDIPAFSEDVPYHYVVWGFPADGREHNDSFSIALAASRDIPVEELVRLGQSMFK